ncbi:MAG TPA: DUF2628 domain-containing protein [Alphaproteobacteria bacterium]
MAKPKPYTAHVRRRGPWRESDVVLVKDGFSWPAFFFSFVWSLWHGLWMFTLVIIVGTVALGLASELLAIDPVTEAAAGLGWSLLIGFEANDARRRALARRGFDMTGIVFGANVGEAERHFFYKFPHAAVAAT